jgi:hypothetical protein
MHINTENTRFVGLPLPIAEEQGYFNNSNGGKRPNEAALIESKNTGVNAKCKYPRGMAVKYRKTWNLVMTKIPPKVLADADTHQLQAYTELVYLMETKGFLSFTPVRQKMFMNFTALFGLSPLDRAVISRNRWAAICNKRKAGVKLTEDEIGVPKKTEEESWDGF